MDKEIELLIMCIAQVLSRKGSMFHVDRILLHFKLVYYEWLNHYYYSYILGLLKKIDEANNATTRINCAKKALECRQRSAKSER